MVDRMEGELRDDEQPIRRSGPTALPARGGPFAAKPPAPNYYKLFPCVAFDIYRTRSTSQWLPASGTPVSSVKLAMPARQPA
jgi:hypothetical protein